MDIAVIKLGAKGDVIRTIPLAEGIKKKYPNSKITWITKANISSLLENNPLIDKVFSLPYDGKAKFDILYNFDIEKEATSLASSIDAEKKFGFYEENGYASSFNMGAEYYLNTIFDDSLKKSNRKTYQEMMFEAAELKFEGEKQKIILTDKDKTYGQDFAKKNKLEGKKLVGIHMGASPRWPSKAWAESRVEEFIISAREKGYEVLLFGGPDEVERQKKFVDALSKNKIEVFRNNPKNRDREFAALINLCDVIICSDSFSMHVALALEKPTIGLFFCTSPDEVEGYGLLKKVVAKKLYDYFPEKMDQYSKELTESISAGEVLSEVDLILNRKRIKTH